MFSGPTKAINDAKRAEYMANLELTASLDDRILQATKLNLRTGQPSSVPTDNRSLDEKLADTEMLKAQVRADLLTITDALNMTAIMSALTIQDLRYVAQRFNLLAAEIRPKYKMGITSDQFMIFLRAYVDRAPLVAGPAAGIVNINAIAARQPTRDQLDQLGQIVGQAAADHVPFHGQEGTPELPRREKAVKPRLLSEVQREAAEMGLETHFADRKGRGRQGAHIPIVVLEHSIVEEKARRATIHDYPQAARNLAFSPLARNEHIREHIREAPTSDLGHERFETPAARRGSMTEPARLRALGHGFRMHGRGVHREPLGRYSICLRKLHDDVVQIRSAKGGAVARCPTEKVSGRIAA